MNGGRTINKQNSCQQFCDKPSGQMTGVCINYFFTGLTRALSLFPTEGLKKKKRKKKKNCVTHVFKLICVLRNGQFHI